MKKLSDLEGFITLNRKQLSSIFGGCAPHLECDGAPPGGGGGGAGPCTVQCASGAEIGNAPDCEASTQTTACANQGGPSGYCYGDADICNIYV